MARTQIPVTPMNRRAYVPNATEVIADPTNQMFLVNDGATWIEVRNSNGGAVRSFTVQEIEVIDLDLPVPDRTFPVPASDRGKVGPWPREMYGETIFIDIPVAQTDLRFTAYSMLTS